MTTTTLVNLEDNESVNLKDKLSIGGPNLRGAVEIYEKSKTGLNLVSKKSNLIVYGGREWLIQRAFGDSIAGSSSEVYNKQICLFGVGQGGGEPGNPLQAGVTKGSDTQLLSMVRLRSDLLEGDAAYDYYAGDQLTGDHGYYKKFSSITLKEDYGNPYVDNGVTQYPPLIAEIRIELSSDDANGVGGVDGWADLNEAGLFISDPNDDPANMVESGGDVIGTLDIISITQDGDYTIYMLDSNDLSTDAAGLTQGDYVFTESCADAGNNIPEDNSLIIVDMYNGSTGRNAYIVVENRYGVTNDPETTGSATFVNKLVAPVIMFSRTTFSTLRKSQDRELVFLWKIYF